MFGLPGANINTEKGFLPKGKNIFELFLRKSRLLSWSHAVMEFYLAAVLEHASHNEFFIAGFNAKRLVLDLFASR
jgi:hypothetical protein